MDNYLILLYNELLNKENILVNVENCHPLLEVYNLMPNKAALFNHVEKLILGRNGFEATTNLAVNFLGSKKVLFKIKEEEKNEKNKKPQD